MTVFCRTRIVQFWRWVGDSGRRGSWCPACEWNLGAARLTTTLRLIPGVNGGPLFGPSHRTSDYSPMRCRRSGEAGGWSAKSADGDGDFGRLWGPRRLALLVSGIVLVVLGTLLWKIVGSVVVGVAVELRPRLPGIPATPSCKTRSDVPALFAVTDTVGKALGAPKVHAIIVDETFDASCTRVGFRRRLSCSSVCRWA